MGSGVTQPQAGEEHPRSLPLLGVLLLCTLKDLPVNLYGYPRAKQEGSGAHLGKEGWLVFFCQTSQTVSFPCVLLLGMAPAHVSVLGSAERQPGTREGCGAASPSHS